MTRFLRYASVGVLATAAHYTVLVALVEGLGIAAWVGSGIGATVGAQVAYAGNRGFTFHHHGGVLASWLKFMGTALLGALFGMGVVAAGVHLGLHYLFAQVVATLASLVLTYLVNRHWTFARTVE
jgi:putative flippase GtrA